MPVTGHVLMRQVTGDEMTTMTTQHDLDRPLSRDELWAVLESITYAPSWTANVVKCPFNEGVDFDLELVGGVADTTQWAEGVRSMLPYAQRFHFADGTTLREVQDELFTKLLRLQAHETAEFLRFNKRAPFHPHRMDGRARLSALGVRA